MLRRHWFLAGLFLLLPLGIVLGRADAVAGLDAAVDAIPTAVCTGGILFLMSATLDSRKLMQSLLRPLPVMTACGVNLFLLPLMGMPFLLMHHTPDMKVGLLIVVSVPCTMAAASVWTRKADGNDAVSLLVTLMTNGMCFLITPAWMEVGRRFFHTADTSSVTFGRLVTLLVAGALIPALAGQLARLHLSVRARIDQMRTTISVLAQGIILLLVFVSAFKGGGSFQVDGAGGRLSAGGLLLIWSICVGLHIAAALAAWWISAVFRIAEEDRRAIVFAGSQKTLPIALLLSDATGMSLSIIPMLLYHGSQLFIDTWIVGIFRKRAAPVLPLPIPTSVAGSPAAESDPA